MIEPVAFVGAVARAVHQTSSTWTTTHRNGNENVCVRRRRSNVQMATPLTRDTPRGPVKRVVVTGIGLVSCFGTDPDEFYNSLLAGKSGVRKITNFLTYALVAGKKALENAGIGLGTDAQEALDKARCGVLCGSGMGGLDIYAQGVEKLLTKGHKKMSPFFIPYAITNMASAMLGMECNFMGPNYSVSTACATGNFMINNAAMHIRSGQCDLCLAGGAEAAIVPVGVGGFIACRALSSRVDKPTKASRPWDTARDGFVMGEGAGILVLESMEHALARGAPILAEYLGGSQSCDAHHITEPRQDGTGVRLCIENALVDAGVTKDRVNYINAHATSTPAGDLAEFRAVRSVFDGDVSGLKMNSTKSMIGHALGAAGALEAIATIKAIQTGKVHPTINVDNLESEVDIDIVPNVMQEHKVDVGISNSFGFGGHNATVCFAGVDDV